MKAGSEEGVAMMGWYGPGMGASGMVLMALSSVMFWALMVVALVVLGRAFGWFAPGTTRTVGAPAARNVLDERYARGEIDDDEYQRRLRTLTRDR
jgi:putative membrane protein